MTVREVLKLIAADEGLESTVESSSNSSAPTDSRAVFTSNKRLKAMTENFPSNPALGFVPYTALEVGQLVEGLSLNPSQINAVIKAVTRPLSLIQGPPGTGKTRTACAILHTLGTHSLTGLLTHSLSYSLTHSLNHPLIKPS